MSTFANSGDNKAIEHKILSFNIEKVSKKIKMINDSIENKKINSLNFVQTHFEILELQKEKKSLVNSISEMDKYNFTIYKDKVHDLTQLFDYNKILMREVQEEIAVSIIQLILFSLLFIILYFSFIKIKKKNIEKELKLTSDFEDADTLFRYHKIRIRTIFFTVYFGLLIAFYLIGNIKFFLSILSLVSAVLILGVREQLGDIIVGFLFNTSATRNIMKGSFIIGDKIEFVNNSDLKGTYHILKFNLFKTVLYNEAINDFLSIRNSDLIRNEIRHMPLNKLHTLKLTYTVPSSVDFRKLNESVSAALEQEFSNDKYNLSFTEVRKEIPEIKNVYGKIPKLKNNLRFLYKSRNELSFELTVSFTIYTSDIKTDIHNFFYMLIHSTLLDEGFYKGFEKFNFYLHEENRRLLAKKESKREDSAPTEI